MPSAHSTLAAAIWCAAAWVAVGIDCDKPQGPNRVRERALGSLKDERLYREPIDDALDLAANVAVHEEYVLHALVVVLVHADVLQCRPTHR